jgi:hypothetical protein
VSYPAVTAGDTPAVAYDDALYVLNALSSRREPRPRLAVRLLTFGGMLIDVVDPNTRPTDVPD